jgi:hypothetical protein
VIPQEALLMAGEHLAVLPIGAGTKYPPFDEWQNQATDVVDVLEAWWPNGSNRGVGWKMGLQPDGRWLFAIDVDVNKGGKPSMQELIHEYGLRDELAGTVTARTGGGGYHFVFELPSDPVVTPTNRSKLRAGIDVRAEGGQIVVAPSIHPVSGMAYSWAAGKAPWQIAPLVASAGLMAMLVALLSPPPPSLMLVGEQDLVSSRTRHPSNGHGLSPADFVHARWDFSSFLVKHGWTPLGGEAWRRPGKTDRGSSAQLKNNGLGPLNVFTTEIPVELERLGKLDATGQCVSLTLFNFVAGYEYSGDTSALARAVLQDPLYLAELPTVVTGQRASEPATTVADATSALWLPSDWYDQRPWMAACRQMAQAVGGSPSAHLLAYLTRWATLIPPGYTIPPINGAPSSFDLLSVIAGTSGSGKTSPMTNAETLLPIRRPEIRAGLGIGSGEGIIEMFYGSEQVVDDDGKKRTDRRKIYAGVNFAVSEGLIFADLADRGGTTHVTRLCDAWSGAALSTANAKAETFRHVERGQYRLTMVMGIQATQAHELMTDSAASQGFVGRLLFAWAEEPRISPRPRPPEPPLLVVPGASTIPATSEHPLLYQQIMLSYPQAVYDEIQSASDQRVGTNVPVEEHHHDLLRCKVAGIMALMEGRTDVSEADWALATDLVDISAAVRRHLYSVRRFAERDKRHSQAVAKAEVEIVIEDVKDRQGVARMAEAIRAAAPGAQGAIRKKVSAASTRHRFDPALRLAIANGWVVVHNGRIEPI